MGGERYPLSVLMVRTPVGGRWGGVRWEARAVIDAGARGDEGVLTLFDGDAELQRLHPGHWLELRRDEAQGYYLNCSAPNPSVFVMWRLREEEAVPVLLSASYDEAARWLDAGEQVDAVAMPAPLREAVVRFAAEHYRPAPKRARKRDRRAVDVPKP